MQKPISWILEFTAKLPNNKERIACLRANAHPAVLTILRYCFDPKINWLLPETDPPYKPNVDQNLDSALYHEARKLYLFVEGGNPNLQQFRRELLFIAMLESIHPEDAKLLLCIKNKKLPHKVLNKNLILKAFPDLLS